MCLASVGFVGGEAGFVFTAAGFAGQVVIPNEHYIDTDEMVRSRLARMALTLMTSSSDSALRLLSATLTPRSCAGLYVGDAHAKRAREEVTKAMVNIVEEVGGYGYMGIWGYGGM